MASAGPSMHETCSSFCEEEADFLTELLVKQVCSSPACCCQLLYVAARACPSASLLTLQEAASQPIHLFPDDGAESSGTQAAMSDVSTT